MPCDPMTGPSSLDLTPRQQLAALARRIGEQPAARACAELLEGADPRDHVEVMSYLAGRSLERVPAADWPAYWVRTWGARGLRYVWTDEVSPTVVAGLADEHWRPAEMCLKVAWLRELGEAGPGAERLSRHQLTRVRVAAIRCLGKVGDTEHVEVVQDSLDDENADVRRAAARALVLLDRRLDLGLDGPELA